MKAFRNVGLHWNQRTDPDKIFLFPWLGLLPLLASCRLPTTSEKYKALFMPEKKCFNWKREFP